MADEVKVNILDRVVSFLNPEAGFKRLQYRFGLQQLSGYGAARRDRLQPWSGTSGPAEQTAGPARSILRARARDLEINSDLGQAAVGALVRNVVGTGIRPQAQVRLKSGKLDAKTNKALEELWERWTRPQACDISRRASFYEFQRIMLLRRIVDGESLCQLITDRDAHVPLKLQGLEADMLVEYMFKTEAGSNYIINGVEVNEYNAPVAYWIQPMTPDGLSVKNPVRIPAERMLHLYRLDRWSQVRGVSELAIVMRRLRETGEYLDAELIASKIAACFAMFITKTSPGTQIGRSAQDASGRRLESIEPGMIEYMEPGEDVKFANPTRTASVVKDFVQLEQRMAGAGLGLSYEAISRDVSQTNYSSARVNLLEDRRNYRIIQQFMIDHFCQPVWEHFVEAAVLAGAVNISGFWQDPERYTACRWVAPGWDWVDPVKEVKATKEQLRGGLTTLQTALGERGQDWETVLEQAAAERERAAQLGLRLDVLGSAPESKEKGDDDNADDK